MATPVSSDDPLYVVRVHFELLYGVEIAAFAETKDGREWRLSEDEIAAALNGQHGLQR